MIKEIQLDWINKENERAIDLCNKKETQNKNAPKLIKQKLKKPVLKRQIKSIFLQKSFSIAFDKLVFDEKMKSGKNAPQLIEEAIELLVNKYKKS